MLEPCAQSLGFLAFPEAVDFENARFLSTEWVLRNPALFAAEESKTHQKQL